MNSDMITGSAFTIAFLLFVFFISVPIMKWLERRGRLNKMLKDYENHFKEALSLKEELMPMHRKNERYIEMRIGTANESIKNNFLRTDDLYKKHHSLEQRISKLEDRCVDETKQ